MTLTHPAPPAPTAPGAWQLTAGQQQMVTRHLGLVRVLLTREFPWLARCPDAFQDGAMGLMRASIDHDPTVATFATYAWRAIRWAVQRGIDERRGPAYKHARLTGGSWRPPLSLDQLADPDRDHAVPVEIADLGPPADHTAETHLLVTAVARALAGAVGDDLDRDLAAQILARSVGAPADSHREVAERHQVPTGTAAGRHRRLQLKARAALTRAGLTSTGNAKRPAGQVPHGTRSRYVAGCHCRDCRAANTRYSRRRRHP